MSTDTIRPPSTHSRWVVATWAVVAAFGTYFCMYAFRKPFTAASFADSAFWGLGFKTILVSSQVLGYMLSKFVGIRVIAEMPAARRGVGILVLIGIAEVALVLFGLVPRPWNILCLFLNGLPLGMVFGLVLGFLEGRRETEALTSGLCVSFIVASGVTKSLGTWLLGEGISEEWMPAVAGGLFVIPLIVFVGLLTRLPPPNREDEEARSRREPLDKSGRRALASRYLLGLLLVVVVYTIVTILRSIRDDFAPELFKGLGETASASSFAYSDMLVGLVILIISGCGILIQNNRRAFFVSLGWSIVGCGVLIGATLAVQAGHLTAFPFMVLSGLGLYLPYVMIHTTLFERLLASTRDVGNIGFLMYVADAFGYLGYVGVMVGRGWFSPESNEALVSFFTLCCLGAGLGSIVLLIGTMIYFAEKIPRRETDHA
jgi:Family of unknown function (DUF5690)